MGPPSVFCQDSTFYSCHVNQELPSLHLAECFLEHQTGFGSNVEKTFKLAGKFLHWALPDFEQIHGSGGFFYIQIVLGLGQLSTFLLLSKTVAK